jgi:hypothetical protein
MRRTMRMRPARRIASPGEVTVKRRDGQLYTVLPPRVAGGGVAEGQPTVHLTVESGEIVVRWTDRRTRPKKLKRGK